MNIYRTKEGKIVGHEIDQQKRQLKGLKMISNSVDFRITSGLRTSTKERIYWENERIYWENLFDPIEEN